MSFFLLFPDSSKPECAWLHVELCPFRPPSLPLFCPRRDRGKPQRLEILSSLPGLSAATCPSFALLDLRNRRRERAVQPETFKCTCARREQVKAQRPFKSAATDDVDVNPAPMIIKNGFFPQIMVLYQYLRAVSSHAVVSDQDEILR